MEWLSKTIEKCSWRAEKCYVTTCRNVLRAIVLLDHREDLTIGREIPIPDFFSWRCQTSCSFLDDEYRDDRWLYQLYSCLPLIIDFFFMNRITCDCLPQIMRCIKNALNLNDNEEWIMKGRWSLNDQGSGLNVNDLWIGFRFDHSSMIPGNRCENCIWTKKDLRSWNAKLGPFSTDAVVNVSAASFSTNGDVVESENRNEDESTFANHCFAQEWSLFIRISSVEKSPNNCDT